MMGRGDRSNSQTTQKSEAVNMPLSNVIKVENEQADNHNGHLELMDVVGVGAKDEASSTSRPESQSVIVSSSKKRLRTSTVLEEVDKKFLLEQYVQERHRNANLQLQNRISQLEKELADKDKSIEEKEKIHQETLAVAEQHHRGNFGEELAKVLEAEFNCSICAEVFIEPSVISCGHTYCNYCITRALQVDFLCPICRTGYNFNPPAKNIEMRNFILKVYSMLPEEMRVARAQIIQEREALPPPAPRRNAGRASSRRRRLSRSVSPFNFFEFLNDGREALRSRDSSVMSDDWTTDSDDDDDDNDTDPVVEPELPTDRTSPVITLERVDNRRSPSPTLDFFESRGRQRSRRNPRRSLSRSLSPVSVTFNSPRRGESARRAGGAANSDRDRGGIRLPIFRAADGRVSSLPWHTNWEQWRERENRRETERNNRTEEQGTGPNTASSSVIRPTPLPRQTARRGRFYGGRYGLRRQDGNTNLLNNSNSQDNTPGTSGDNNNGNDGNSATTSTANARSSSTVTPFSVNRDSLENLRRSPAVTTRSWNSHRQWRNHPLAAMRGSRRGPRSRYIPVPTLVDRPSPLDNFEALYSRRESNPTTTGDSSTITPAATSSSSAANESAGSISSTTTQQQNHDHSYTSGNSGAAAAVTTSNRTTSVNLGRLINTIIERGRTIGRGISTGPFSTYRTPSGPRTLERIEAIAATNAIELNGTVRRSPRLNRVSRSGGSGEAAEASTDRHSQNSIFQSLRQESNGASDATGHPDDQESHSGCGGGAQNDVDSLGSVSSTGATVTGGNGSGRFETSEMREELTDRMVALRRFVHDLNSYGPSNGHSNSGFGTSRRLESSRNRTSHRRRGGPSIPSRHAARRRNSMEMADDDVDDDIGMDMDVEELFD